MQLFFLKMILHALKATLSNSRYLIGQEESYWKTKQPKVGYLQVDWIKVYIYSSFSCLTATSGVIALPSEYTERYKFNVLGTFGGDYESAKSDERKEFKRMFDFIKKSKLKVSYIIVYKLDRFSRTGPNAIYLKDQLQNQGIYILSVTEPSDPTTISGTFQQDIQLVVSKFDNAQRRERTINGMRERLRAGYWSGPVPTGYDIYHKGKEQIIVVNEQGKLLRKAFEWKGNEGLSNTEIMHRLRKLGLNFDRKKMTDMFRNPFYCGIITHKLLDGQVVEGKHEKLITKELFLGVNNIQLNVSQGWKVKFENNDIPLNAVSEMQCMRKEHERISCQKEKDPLLQMRHSRLPLQCER